MNSNRPLVFDSYDALNQHIQGMKHTARRTSKYTYVSGDQSKLHRRFCVDTFLEHYSHHIHHLHHELKHDLKHFSVMHRSTYEGFLDVILSCIYAKRVSQSYTLRDAEMEHHEIDGVDA